MRRVVVIVITAFATKDPLEAGNPHCVLTHYRDVSFLLQGHLHRYLFSQRHLAWAAESTAHLARGRTVDLAEITSFTLQHKDVSPSQSLTCSGKALPSVNILCALWLEVVVQLQWKLLQPDVMSEKG